MEATRTPRPAEPAPAPSPTPAAPSTPARMPMPAAPAGPPALRLEPQGAAGPATSGPVADLIRSPGPGDPLQAPVREALESRLQVDLSPVRVHTDARTGAVVDGLPARAFTYAAHVFLGSRERASDLGLMAHEVAHVVQQRGGPVLQLAPSSVESAAGSPHEAEARQASAAVVRGESVSVQTRTGGPMVQGQFEEGSGGWLEEKAWGLLNRYAPELAPIIRQGVGTWLETQIMSAVEGIFNTLAAPVRMVTGLVQTLSTHFAELLTWMRDAAEKIAKGDCSSLAEAAEKIQKVVAGIAAPIIDKIKLLAGKVADFFKDIWDRFGAPAWEFLKRVGGQAWDKIQKLASWIWDKTAPMRSILSRAWTWVKNKLGIGEGPEGQNGILQWVQAKASAAWDVIKAKVEQYKKPLMVVAGILVMLSPAGPIIAIGAAVGGLIMGARWIAQHFRTRDGVVEQRGVFERTIIPAITGAVDAVSGALSRAAAFVTEKLNGVMGGLGQVVGAIGGSIIRFAVGIVQWIADQFRGLAAWATNQLSQLGTWVKNGLDRLKVFLQPILQVLIQVGTVVVDILKLPMLVLGRLWRLIPACLRDPFVDFLVNRVLKQIPIFGELVAIVELWPKIRAEATKIVRQIFTTGDLKGAAITVFKLALAALKIPLELVTGIFTKGAAALDLILKNPTGFLRNLLNTIKQGFSLFFGKIGTHLLNGVAGWLFGQLGEAGIRIPTDLSFRSIFGLVLDIFGITIGNVLDRLGRRAGRAVADRLRTVLNVLTGAWEWAAILFREGPGGLWRKLQQRLSDLWKTLLDGVIGWVIRTIIEKVTIKLLSMLDPTGVMAVVNSIIAFYRAVQSFVERLREILQVINTIMDSLMGIAQGAIGAAAGLLERGLGAALPIVISFLANQVSLRNLGKRIREIASAVQEKIGEGMDWLIDLAMKSGTAFLNMLGLGGGAGGPAGAAGGDVRTQARNALTRELRADHTPTEAAAIVRGVFARFRAAGLRRLELGRENDDGDVVINAEASPLLPLAYLRRRFRKPVGPKRAVSLAIELRLLAPATVTPERVPSVSESASVPHGGQVLRQRPGEERIVRMMTWNTADITVSGNNSHAEHQFVAWMNRQGDDFMRNVQDMMLNLFNFSPCSQCGPELAGLLRRMAALGSPVAQGRRARIYWTELYVGQQPTSWSTLREMQGAGWMHFAPREAMPPDANHLNDVFIYIP